MALNDSVLGYVIFPYKYEYTSAVSDAPLWQKRAYFIFFWYDTETTPDTRPHIM